MGEKVIMKQPSKRDLIKIKEDVSKAQNWEKVEGFTASRPTSIRLSPKLVHDLQELAELHGEKSYQALLKRWVTEKVSYEMELIELVSRKKAVGE